MTKVEISEGAKKFIFAHVDSVESLEVLLRFFVERSKSWTAERLASDLRLNPNSVTHRIQFWVDKGLIGPAPQASDQFSYREGHPEIDSIVLELEELFRRQRHRILEMIFSPSKRARDFADAFKIGKDNPDGRDNS